MHPLMTIGVAGVSYSLRISSSRRTAFAVRFCESVLAVAELLAPVRVGSPRRGLENEAGLEFLRELRVGQEVFPEDVLAFRRLEQGEGREMRKILPFQEDERGLDPAVGHEEVAGELRQGASIFRHVCLLLVSQSSRPDGKAKF